MLVLRRCRTFLSLSLHFFSLLAMRKRNQQQNNPESQKLTSSRLLRTNVGSILFGYLSAICSPHFPLSPAFPSFFFFTRARPQTRRTPSSGCQIAVFIFRRPSSDRGGRRLSQPATASSLPPPALTEEGREFCL